MGKRLTVFSGIAVLLTLLLTFFQPEMKILGKSEESVITVLHDGKVISPGEEISSNSVIKVTAKEDCTLKIKKADSFELIAAADEEVKILEEKETAEDFIEPALEKGSYLFKFEKSSSCYFKIISKTDEKLNLSGTLKYKDSTLTSTKVALFTLNGNEEKASASGMSSSESSTDEPGDDFSTSESSTAGSSNADTSETSGGILTGISGSILMTDETPVMRVHRVSDGLEIADQALLPGQQLYYDIQLAIPLLGRGRDKYTSIEIYQNLPDTLKLEKIEILHAKSDQSVELLDVFDSSSPPNCFTADHGTWQASSLNAEKIYALKSSTLEDVLEYDGDAVTMRIYAEVKEGGNFTESRTTIKNYGRVTLDSEVTRTNTVENYVSKLDMNEALINVYDAASDSDIDTKPVDYEQEIYYDIQRKADLMGETISAPYSSFIISGMNPAGISVTSAEVYHEKANGTKSLLDYWQPAPSTSLTQNFGVWTFDSIQQNISYAMKENGLKNILKHNGDKIILRIHAAVREASYFGGGVTYLQNKGAVSINDIVQETNEVTNPAGVQVPAAPRQTVTKSADYYRDRMNNELNMLAAGQENAAVNDLNGYYYYITQPTTDAAGNTLSKPGKIIIEDTLPKGVTFKRLHFFQSNGFINSSWFSISTGAAAENPDGTTTVKYEFSKVQLDYLGDCLLGYDLAFAIEVSVDQSIRNTITEPWLMTNTAKITFGSSAEMTNKVQTQLTPYTDVIAPVQTVSAGAKTSENYGELIKHSELDTLIKGQEEAAVNNITTHYYRVFQGGMDGIGNSTAVPNEIVFEDVLPKGAAFESLTLYATDGSRPNVSASLFPNEFTKNFSSSCGDFTVIKNANGTTSLMLKVTKNVTDALKWGQNTENICFEIKVSADLSFQNTLAEPFKIDNIASVTLGSRKRAANTVRTILKNDLCRLLLIKQDSHDETIKVNGALFELKHPDGMLETFSTSGGSSQSPEGTIDFGGLAIPGNYQLTELKAAEGYELMEFKSVYFTLNEDRTISWSWANTSLYQYTLEKSQTGSIIPTLTITAKNRNRLALPLTGGPGRSIGQAFIITLTMFALPAAACMFKKYRELR